MDKRATRSAPLYRVAAKQDHTRADGELAKGIQSMQLDAVIFGGGAAGLWLLDALERSGRRVLLFEAGELGSGQTIASQGIIHGGLKYSLQGMLTRSAAGIREMPLVWRNCLAGEGSPDLRGTRVRSQCCYLWRTDTVRSRLGMLGAKIGLRVSPEKLAAENRPELLARCPGSVARLDEQVIAPASFIADLAERHLEAVYRIDAQTGLHFITDEAGQVTAVRLQHPQTGEWCELYPAQVILAAGAGNAALRGQIGLPSEVMQRRPLHMAMLRGDLPQLNGHCVDGAKTRVTITSDFDSHGRTVWQVGGQVAEIGVKMSEPVLIEHVRSELSAVIPGIDLANVEWAAYRVDRAEGRIAGGHRPESAQVVRDTNVITAWPTKLALVPELARKVLESIESTVENAPPSPVLPSDWPRPVVAKPPWETAANWIRIDSASRQELAEDAAA